MPQRSLAAQPACVRRDLLPCRAPACAVCHGVAPEPLGWLICARCGAALHRRCEGLPLSCLLGGALSCCSACAVARARNLGPLGCQALARLAELRVRARAAEISGGAAGTQSNHNSRLARYVRFAAGLGISPGTALPAIGALPGTLVEAFLVDLAHTRGSGEVRGGTFAQYVSTLNSWHTARGLARPCDEPSVARMVEGLARMIGERGGQVVCPKVGITLPQLRVMLRGLDASARAAAPGSVAELLHRRDAAILALGFFGWLRAGELAAPVVAHLRETVHSYDLSILKSKTDQHGKGHLQVIAKWPSSGVPVGAILGSYLSGLRARGLAAASAPLFPHVVRGRVTKKHLGGNVVTNVVRAGIDHINRLAILAGKPARLDRRRRAGHSLRRGGFNHGFDSGIGREARQVLGRWRGEASQDTYVEWRHKHRLAVAMSM